MPRQYNANALDFLQRDCRNLLGCFEKKGASIPDPDVLFGELVAAAFAPRCRALVGLHSGRMKKMLSVDDLARDDRFERIRIEDLIFDPRDSSAALAASSRTSPTHPTAPVS